ncbi:MAG: PTS sugar transporter subunit IIA [Elusimicrobiota bacterium]
MSKPAAPIKILDVLKPETILLDVRCTAKNEVISEIVGHLFNKETDEFKQEITRALYEREKLGSTGIGSGVAVPHAKSARMTNVACALAISKKGIDFEALDKAPVHLFFLLAAPLDSHSEHLNILARIVRLLKDRLFRQALREASSIDEVVSLIAQEDNF